MAKERKRRPPLPFTYSQIGVPEYQSIHPVAQSVQTPMVIPDQALGGWLVANSGPCVRQSGYHGGRPTTQLEGRPVLLQTKTLGHDSEGGRTE